MQKSPFISIIIPVYNVEPYIADCIQSVMRQTYQGPMECIVVDDACTDKSMAIAKELIAGYEGPIVFKVLRHEKNRGLSAARNTAMDVATGDFIIAVDSDDWLADHAVDSLLKRQLETGADVVSANVMVHYADEDVLLRGKEYSDREQMVLQMMQTSWNHFFAGNLIRRTVITDNDLHWIEGLDQGEDRYMRTLVAYYSQRQAAVDDVVYYYNRTNASSITSASSNAASRIRYNAQELDYMLVLERFFADKEIKFKKEATQCCMDQMDFNLKNTLAYSMKDEFQRLTAVIDGRSEADCNLIGWKKNGINGRLMHCYCWMRMKWLAKKVEKYLKRKMHCCSRKESENKSNV